MQWVSSRIWTRVAVSISYDDNDYTTGTSKQSDGEAAFQELDEYEVTVHYRNSNEGLLPFWFGVIVPVRVPSSGQIELFNHSLRIDFLNHTIVCKLFVLDWNTWNHTIVWKLIVLDRNTWNHTPVCKLFVFDRNTELRILNTNTRNHLAVCK